MPFDHERLDVYHLALDKERAILPASVSKPKALSRHPPPDERPSTKRNLND